MSPELLALARGQGGTFTRAQALSVGYAPAEIRRLLRGEWTTLRPGTYLPTAEWSALTQTERHRTLLVARLADKPDAVASHLSGAVVRRLPLLGGSFPPRLTLTRASGANVRRADLRIVVAPLADDEVDLVDGVRTTSTARTLLDCARGLPFVDAVVLADAALHRLLTSPAELTAMAERQAGWPGVPGARRVVAFADGRAETPGESVSRVVFTELGLPAPDLQVALTRADGSVYRADFYWAKYRTVGAFDGAVKYRGDQGAEALVAEKIREDNLRDAGNEVFRWVWRELFQSREELGRRALRTFARGERRAA
jgi:Transcriptional regulator, AbiEi antitoxin